jgi:hypothetical protein
MRDIRSVGIEGEVDEEGFITEEEGETGIARVTRSRGTTVAIDRKASEDEGEEEEERSEKRKVPKMRLS